MAASISKRNRICRTALRYGGWRANGQCRLEREDRDAPPIEHRVLPPQPEAGRLSL